MTAVWLAIALLVLASLWAIFNDKNDPDDRDEYGDGGL